MPNLNVRKPKAILFDIVGTVTKSNFIDKVLWPYVNENVEVYLSNNWGKKVLMNDIELLREQSHKDGEPIPRAGSNPVQIQRAVTKYVHHCNSAVIDHEAIRIFRFHMIFDGYNRGKLTTAVYKDAYVHTSAWAKEDIDLYVLSNGWGYAIKKMLSKTTHGDMTLVVKKYFDTEMGSMEDPNTYQKVIRELGHAPEDIIFLTHRGMQGVAAHQAKLSVVLVCTHREDLAREAQKDEVYKCGLPAIRIFDELIFSRDAPVASSMVDEVEMSKAVAASRAGSSMASGSKRPLSRGSNKSSSRAGSATSMSRTKSSCAAGSSSKGASSAASGSSSRPSSSRASGSSSALSGSKSSAASSASGSSSAGSSSAASGSHSSSSAASSGSSSSAASSGSSSKGGSSTSASSSGSKHSKH